MKILICQEKKANLEWKLCNWWEFATADNYPQIEREKRRKASTIQSSVCSTRNLRRKISILIDLYAPVLCKKHERVSQSLTQINGWTIQQVNLTSVLLDYYLF